MERRDSVRRRRLLVVGGVLLTGCLAEGDDGAGEALDDVEEFSDAEPADYPDETCAVCARGVRDYPGWNAQMVHEDGERVFFCTSGCMGAYYTSPDSFGFSDADVARVWVTDYETDETVDGEESYYVFPEDPELVDTPPGRNPLPFRERERAEGFVKEFEELGTSSVERFSVVNFNRCTW